MLNRRQVIQSLGACAAVPLAAATAAQTYANKPIRIVVPFGAGGVADLTARAVGQKLSEQLGQSVVITASGMDGSPKLVMKVQVTTAGLRSGGRRRGERCA